MSRSLFKTSSFLDGHTIEKMRVVWKKGFDQSKVTDNNYISLTQFEYAVFFEENYEEEIASGNAQWNELTQAHFIKMRGHICFIDKKTFELLTI